MTDPAETERRIEALLFAAAGPAQRRGSGAAPARRRGHRPALAALQMRYAGRGVDLVCVGGRWRFQTADRPRLPDDARSARSPAGCPAPRQETLAIIAYHQPVTRAEIEAIRGVQANRGTLDLLLELGLVRMRGRRRTPGRPITFGTTDVFLEHYGLASLADLPGSQEMKALGLLSLDAPAAFAPPDLNALTEDEEPLGAEDTPEFHQRLPGRGGLKRPAAWRPAAQRPIFRLCPSCRAFKTKRGDASRRRQTVWAV